jgi:hypothetical protein
MQGLKILNQCQCQFNAYALIYFKMAYKIMPTMGIYDSSIPHDMQIIFPTIINNCFLVNPNDQMWFLISYFV